jgi:hypothetical protein
MIYEVKLQAPAINEIVMTSADSEEQAIEYAVYSALQRMLKSGEAVATAIPAPLGARMRESGTGGSTGS